jgi:epoxide hydrolase-like predicted phosphatase
MEKKYKAVIFDMGGVLLRSVDSAPRDAIANRFGTSREELEKFVFRGPTSVQSEIGQVSDIFHWQTVLKHFGHSEEDPRQIYVEYFSGDAIDQELLGFAESLKPKLKIGLLSNAWVDSRKRLGALFHFIEIFDVSIFSAEVKERKPEPEIYRIMLDRLEVKPEESIFIDDFPENIEGAKKLGITTILFKNTKDTIQNINFMLGRG